MKKLILFAFILFSFSSSDEKIDVNLSNLNIMELIKITSSTLNKNILVSQNIKGKVNFISSKPISKSKLLDVLKLSLEDYGYILKETNGILKIYKKVKTQNLKNQKAELVKEKKVLNKNLTTEVLSLEYSDASELNKVLHSLNILTKTGITSAVDVSNNLLILWGEKKYIKKVINIVKNLDIPKTQVYVKAKIIEVDDNLLDEVGIKFGILGAKLHSGNLYTFSSSLNGGDAIALNTNAIGLNLPNVTSSLALGASINLLNKTYALDIISEPSILCVNNKESLIYVGETISIQTGNTISDSGNTVNVYKREDIGLTLKVKPRVSNNRVTMELNTILEGVKTFNTRSSNPDTNKKEIRTTAIVNNGESVILGGLIESKSENSVEKIPIAGDIPLIGELFKNRLKDKKSKNLVIVITPYIIPKTKDVSYVRDELSKLKILEDKFLGEALKNLKNKKDRNENLDKKNETKNEDNRKKVLEEYFNL